MNADSGSRRRRTRRVPYGEAPAVKHQTLSDEQVNFLVDKQLNTNVTLHTELARDSAFTSGFHMSNLFDSKQGKLSLEQFKQITQEENYEQVLREHGLNDEEILLKMKLQFKGKDGLTECEQRKLVTIQKKMDSHQEELQKDIKYSNTRYVTRMEYDTNNAQYNDNSSTEARFLVEVKNKVFPENDPVLLTLKEYEEEKKESVTSAGHKRKRVCTPSSSFIGPLLSDVNTRVEVIPKDVICKNKMSMDEIYQTEKFKNYKVGDPNKVLYLKNLAKNVTDRDLAKLFSHFYNECEKSFVSYKIMNGRMRGQAFVTFRDEKIANEALHLCNGYKLYGRPVIISFARVGVT